MGFNHVYLIMAGIVGLYFIRFFVQDMREIHPDWHWRWYYVFFFGGLVAWAVRAFFWPLFLPYMHIPKFRNAMDLYFSTYHGYRD